MRLFKLVTTMAIICGGLYWTAERGRSLGGGASGKKSSKTKASVAAQPEGPKKVKIFGKWYDYREDNIYVVEGVRTYYKATPVVKPARPSKSAKRTVASAVEGHEDSKGKVVAQGSEKDVERELAAEAEEPKSLKQQVQEALFQAEKDQEKRVRDAEKILEQ